MRQDRKIICYLLWVLVAGLFFPLLSLLYRQRWDALGYGHAYFILPLSLGLAFLKRKELARTFAGAEAGKMSVTPSLAMFIFGALLYVFGWRKDYMVVSTFALIPFLYGFVGFVYGKRVQRILLFPILYLLLLVPPPFALLDSITLPLRYISAFGVEIFFGLFNFPVQREGLMYIVNGHPMMIEEACSGFRSFITMLSLSLAYVYLIKADIAKKITLILSIAPLTIFGNILRIIVISLISINLGQGAAEGFLHSFSGVVVFLFIVLGFVGIEGLWAKGEGRGTRDERFEWFWSDE